MSFFESLTVGESLRAYHRDIQSGISRLCTLTRVEVESSYTGAANELGFRIFYTDTKEEIVKLDSNLNDSVPENFQSYCIVRDRPSYSVSASLASPFKNDDQVQRLVNDRFSVRVTR